jgi:hypothetical protein
MPRPISTDRCGRLHTSAVQNPDEVAAALEVRFPTAQVVGCTTAGEHLSGRHFNGALVVTGVQATSLRVSTALLCGLASFREVDAREAVDSLFSALGVDRDDLDPSHYFCLMFIDGLTMKEEAVSAAVADALEGIPLVGGSAGDDLRFARTAVFHEGRAHSDAAVLVLGHAPHGYQVIKHQHYVTTPRALAITKADVDQRRVYEMDGRPAARAYAQALGLERSALTDEASFLNPLTFSCNGQIYVRSVQKIHDDDSISFYCGIEEGMVLEVGGHEDMVEALTDDLFSHRPADLLIGCNCILRALEATAKDSHDALGRALSRVATHSIGFDTYGEQLNGLHINQTLVALALAEP